MSETAIQPAVGPFITETVRNVFDTMLGMVAEPTPPAHLESKSDRVSGAIGLAGETLSASIYIHFSGQFACQAAAALLGLGESELGEAEVNDVAGELTNMVAGGLKSHFCDTGWPCAASTPTIIRGTHFEIEAAPDVQRERLAFTCQGQPFLIEIHLKLN